MLKVPIHMVTDAAGNFEGMNIENLTQSLVESFNALADEVQNLTDRKTILEHKLRFAHEQYQHLADKYAPAAPEVSETLAKLQLPPEVQNPSLANTNFVPLPRRTQPGSSQAQLAVVIREGRRAAHQLATLSDPSKGSHSSRDTSAPPTMTSMSTALEQDFTVEGKKGDLKCPFSAGPRSRDGQATLREGNAQTSSDDPTPHQSADPICAAMYEENMSMPPPPSNGNSASKCPIRFLDKHSPEEIAHYVETHKHEIPRSHEVCVRRYQRNEEQIKKLDAKYGSLVSMIQDLSHLHKPMLPLAAEGNPQQEVDKASNQRVETWAQDVSATVSDDPDDPDRTAQELVEVDHLERESHFDRPLKEVRVGESPSRPWGISVPLYEGSSQANDQRERAESPPPAPVRMPSSSSQAEGVPPTTTRKCPFDHTKFQFAPDDVSPQPKVEEKSSVNMNGIQMHHPYTPTKQPVLPSSPPPIRPAFLNPPDPTVKAGVGNVPQMLFTGPVFIGYPIEQAIQFMQHFQGGQ